MSLRRILRITRREYLTRLRTKGFWITTALVPVLLAASAIIPSLVMSRSAATLRLGVVDLSGQLAGPLEERLGETAESSAGGRRATHFEIETLPAPAGSAAEELRADLDRRVLAGELQAWVWIPADTLTRDEPRVEYHAESVSNFMTQEALRSGLTAVAREQRLTAAGYDSAEIRRLSNSVRLDTVRTSKEGSRAEGGLLAFFLALGLFIVLYTTLIMYGTQVMNSVLEEKTSRIVEVILATVSPGELMAGKLIGICCLALTQLAIWIGLSAVILAPGAVTGLAMLPAGVTLPTLSLSIVFHFFLLFILGFFFYASFYAMLGAAFNSAEEAQQMAGLVVIFLVLPWLVFMPILNDPDGRLAVICSLIPPLTPTVLMLRIAAKMPPLWQILVGELLLALACVGAVWLAGRIYRVGILMYGKKPTLGEIARWVRYS